MKSKYIFPSVVAAMALGYYFLIYKKPAAAPVDPGTLIPDDPTNDYMYDPATGQLLHPSNADVHTYTPSTPTSSIITSTDPVKKQYLSSIASRIPATAPIWPALNAMSQQGLAFLWSITQDINYADQPGYYAQFVKMTDAELANVWNYVSGYLIYNKPLLSASKMLANGQWDNSNPGNPQLYTAINNIHLKYGIF